MRMNEDNYEIMVKSPQLLLLNTVLFNEYCALQDIEVTLKVPNDLKLLKDFCNWELNLKI